MLGRLRNNRLDSGLVNILGNIDFVENKLPIFIVGLDRSIKSEPTRIDYGIPFTLLYIHYKTKV